MKYKRFDVIGDTIHLNKWHILVSTKENDEAKPVIYDLYLNDEELEEWEVNRVPKHRLWEITSKEELTGYEWMEGLHLRTDNPERELAEITAYGSIEAYEASLPESRDAFEVETDYRLSMLELGI